MKLGYKNTEVGVIPFDWVVSPISSLLEPNARITYGVVQPGRDDSFGVPFIRGGDIFDGKIDVDGLRKISIDVSERYGRTVLRGGEIVISLVGFPGEAAIVSRDLSGANIARQVALVRLSEDAEVCPEYLCHYLRSPQGKRLLLKDAIGSAQQVINLRDVNRFEFPLPSNVEEQSVISVALDDVDELLAGLDKLIAKKRDIKQATMQQLLTGKTRLPGFTGAWEVKSVGDLTECFAGGTPATSVDEYWGGGIRWMNSGDLNLRRVHEVEGRITAAGLENSSAKLIPVGCVLIGLAGQGKTRGTVAVNYVQLCTNQSIAAIFPSRHFSSEYLYQALDFRYEELRGLSDGGGGRGGLNIKIIKNLRIPFPSLEEQVSIADVLSGMDEDVERLESQREKVFLLKQGMMQELLTGRTRLV